MVRVGVLVVAVVAAVVVVHFVVPFLELFKKKK
jgi:hypothetical protein